MLTLLYALNEWFSGRAERNAPKGLLMNHIIILGSALL